LLAVIIFAAANSVTRKLTEIGSQNFIDGRNPSHFAMFYLWKYLRVAGLAYNLLATVEHLFLPAVFLKDWGSMVQWSTSGSTSPRRWPPDDATSRTHRVASTLALSIWLLGERTNGWEVTGAIVSFIGVVVTVVFQGLWDTMGPAGFGIGWGEILTAIGCGCSPPALLVKLASTGFL